MNDLIRFEFEGKQVRTLQIDGEPWWIAKDVCDVLGISKHRDALTRLDDDERGSVRVDTLGGPQETGVINESGLYSLILRSQKPDAKVFKKWVTSEVLPSIRKTGGYQVPTYPEALRIAADALDKLEEAKPAIDFYKAVTDSKTAIPISQVAKVLDAGIGRNKLFGFLRDQGVLMINNEPYQRYIDEGWFRVIEQKYQLPDGEVRINIKTLAYQKGVDGIRRLVSKHLGIESKKTA